MSREASREKLADLAGTLPLEAVSYLLAAASRRCVTCGGKMRTTTTKRGFSSRIRYLRCDSCGAKGKVCGDRTPACPPNGAVRK